MRKTTLLLMALLLSVCLCGCYGIDRDRPLQRVSLYFSQKSEIITLSYEDYIVGCIFGRINPSAGEEALKAVACAVNTYALYQLENVPKHTFAGADFSDNEAVSQPFVSADEAKALYGSSYPVYLEKVRAAAEYGMSHIITYEGELILPEMCRLSAGKTDGGVKSYLKSADCAEDKKHEDYISTSAFSESTVRKSLTDLIGVCGLSADCGNWFSTPEYAESGTLTAICFGGTRVSGEQLRKVFSLRSTAITAEYAEGRFVFACKGYGSNKGMSINTAGCLAKEGYTAEQIIHYFYEGIEITKS